MDAQNVLIGMASLLTRHESWAVHNGGSARGYLAGLSRRQRSGHHGHPRTMASVPWIFIQTIVSPECALFCRCEG